MTRFNPQERKAEAEHMHRLWHKGTAPNGKAYSLDMIAKEYKISLTLVKTMIEEHVSRHNKRSQQMKTVTIYRDDMNNRIHGNLFNSLLEDLGIETHVTVAGKSINREIDSVDIVVMSATESEG